MRALVLCFGVLFISQVHADYAQTCSDTRSKSITDCQSETNKAEGDQAAQSQLVSDQCADSAMADCASKFGDVGKKSTAAFTNAKGVCKEKLDKCKKDCDVSKAPDNEKQMVQGFLKECNQKVSQNMDKLSQGIAGTKTATTGGDATSKASGSQPANSSPTQASAPPSAPPAPPPSSPQQSSSPQSQNSTPDTSSKTPDTSTASTASTAPPNGTAQQSASFKEPPQCAAGATDIAGCSKAVGAFPETGTAAVPYQNNPLMGSSAGSPGGGAAAGGGGGGSMGGAPGAAGATLDKKPSEAELLKALAGKKEAGSLGGESGGGGFSYNGGSGSHGLEDLFTNSRSPAGALKPGVKSSSSTVTASDGTKMLANDSPHGAIKGLSTVVGNYVRCHFTGTDCVKK